MMNDSPWNKFFQVFNKLAEDEQNQELWYAIESWCNELSSDEVIKLDANQIKLYIQKWINEQSIQKKSYNLHKQLSFKLLYLSWIPNKIRDQISNVVNINDFEASVKELKSEMNIKYILLIAFVLTGVGVVLYLLVQKGNGNPESSPKREPDNTSKNRLSPSTKHILILVINAQNNERIIRTLAREKQVTSMIWENIHRSTKALWIGKKENFDVSSLNSPFSQAETLQPFEYDVYFIKIELSEYDPRFEEGKDTLERSDAFEYLTQTTHKIRNISKRLSYQSTNNLPLYR